MRTRTIEKRAVGEGGGFGLTGVSGFGLLLCLCLGALWWNLDGDVLFLGYVISRRRVGGCVAWAKGGKAGMPSANYCLLRKYCPLSSA